MPESVIARAAALPTLPATRVVHRGVDLAPFAGHQPPTLRTELGLAPDQRLDQAAHHLLDLGRDRVLERDELKLDVGLFDVEQPAQLLGRDPPLWNQADAIVALGVMALASRHGTKSSLPAAAI